MFDLDGNLVRTFEGGNQDHFANFLKGVRSRKVSDLNADILEGHQSTALCHIGNISYRLGDRASSHEIEISLGRLNVHEKVRETFERTRTHLAENEIDTDGYALTLGQLLELNSENEDFLDHPGANALLTREYRKPFILPSRIEV